MRTMKHCPACDAPNPQTRAACYACRHALDVAPGAARVTRPPHAVPACPNCGSREVERGRPDACAGCGRLMNAATNADVPSPRAAEAPPMFTPAAPFGSGHAPAGPPPGWSVEPLENGTVRLRRLGGVSGGASGKNKGGPATAWLLGASILLEVLTGGMAGSLSTNHTAGVSLLEVGPSRLVVPQPGGLGGGKPRFYTLGTTLTLDVCEPAARVGRGGLVPETAVRRLLAESVAGVTTLDETVPTLWGLPGDASALNALAQFLSDRTGFPLRNRTEASRRWL